MRKKLLVVGAGYGQLPAINSAKEMGLTVLAVDRNPDAIGMQLADESFVVDIIDKEGVLAIAKKYNIQGIITMQSDHGVPTVGYVNDALGLTGISYQTAVDCSNKKNCRMRLERKGCSQPKFVIIKNEVEALGAISKIGFPAVVKSADSSGSRGITKVQSALEIDKAIREAFKYTNGSDILIEEYIDGIEFGAQTFSLNGRCELVLLHNDTMSPPPYMIPIGHSFPFQGLTTDETEFAKEQIKRAVVAMGITHGPANVDVILDRVTKQLKVIEIGARMGATCLPELVYYHTGINWVEASIRSALGEEPDLVIKKNQPVAALIIESPGDGEFKSCSFKGGLENILEFDITAHFGDNVSKLRKGTDRIGKILSIGESLEEAERFAHDFKNSLLFQIEESVQLDQ